MKLNLTYFLGLLLSFSAFSLSAQDAPSVYMEDQTVDPGQLLELNIKVTEFTDIVSTTFTVNWDPTKLRYIGLDNIALGLSEDDSFNAMEGNNGQLTFLYFDSSLAGNSLDDDESLFTLRLEVIGELGDETMVEFGGIMEFVDITTVDLGADFVGALITIGNVNNTSVAVADDFSVAVSPNPFSKDAQLQLVLPESGTVVWSLLELNGQQIAQGQEDFNSGQGNLTLDNTLFKHTGTYLLKLQIGDTVVSKRLMYVVP